MARTIPRFKGEKLHTPPEYSGTQVPVRQPRFLGEKVSYREQSMMEQIQEELGSGYTVESSNGGYVAKAKPVQYVSMEDTRTKKVKAGQVYTYDQYYPHEIFISPQGKILREIKRGVFVADTHKSNTGWRQTRREVYESEVADYEKQTIFTFGKRDLKSGRETIRQTSSNVKGVYKENRIIDQDSKEYEQKKAEHELFSTFTGQGRSYAESRILSRMTEQQREAKFKAEAKARTQRFSAQGISITLQHQAKRDYEKEYMRSAQKYAGDIVTLQEAGREKPPVVESPQPVSSAPFIVAPTPASPTTRTDMGKGFVMPPTPQSGGTISEAKPFQFRTGHTVTDPEKYMQQQQLESDNIVQRQIDKFKFGYSEKTKELDFHPILGSVAVPFSVGAVNIVTGAVAHPVQTVKSMLDPIQMASDIRTELTGLTQTKGEVYSLSYLGGNIAGAEVLGRGTKKGIEVAKDVYVKTGSKYVEPEVVFSEQVLKEGKTFPTTTSTAEALARFNKRGQTIDVGVAKEIIKKPESFARPPVSQPVKISSPVLQDIQVALHPAKPVITGGVARRIVTGKGKIRDVDIITETGKADAYKVAERFPDKYQVIKHEKYPEIYRLREKKTGKVVADFDPPSLAEEGLINPKAMIEVGEYKVVSPEIMLKSKATQIVRGKVNPKYPLKQVENIQQLSPGTPILKEGVVVSTVSPARLKGVDVTGKVEKVGLEDPGVFVSPKGEASPYFTGIEPAETSYSLNPFKGVLGVPTVTEFAIKGVRTYPKDVVMKPGFAHLESFQRTQTGKGQAFITKRSQIGTGDIPRQQFELIEPTEMTGKTVEPGFRMEAGTSEIEAVIGVGESFEYTPKTFFGKIKGFDVYTEYKGRAVAVREAKVITGTDAVPMESIVIPAETIQKGQAMFDVVASESKVTTPTTRAAPYGSLKSPGQVQVQVSTVQTSYTHPTVTQPQVFSAESFKISQQAVSYGVSQLSGGKSVAYSFKISQQAVSYGVSQLSGGKSVAYSFKSAKSSAQSLGQSYRPVSSSSTVGVSSAISRGGGSSGISRGGSSGGGSSGGGSSGISRGGSSGGGSSGGGSSGGGSSGRPSVPPVYPKYYPQPDSEKKDPESFRVEVREKGVFKTIAVTETPEEAFRIGKTKIEHTALASLRVKPVDSHAKVTGIGKSLLPPKKFRLSTKEQDVFIQRRSFRISSPGEKKEIPYKGLQVQKARRIFGNLRRR